MDDLDALLAELEQTTESLSVNDSDPNVCFLLERNNKPKPVAATAESHPTQHPKSTPQEAKKVEPAHNVQTHKEDAGNIYSKILPPQPTSSTSIAQELDDLLACLGTIQSKVSDDLATCVQSTSEEGNTTDNLDSMLKSLTHDMQDLGVATVPKGNCAFCHKPIAGKVVTALGKIWHPEHFTCAHCGTEMGSRPFFERDNTAYCQEDYHQLFSPHCAYCTAPIKEKILTAMDQTWHPEHFFCTHCGTVFGDGVYHVKDGKPYCEKDFQSIFSPKCRGCDRPVMNQYLSALDAVWHPECFVCRDCCCSFTDGSFFELKGQPYCELHFHHHQGTVCHGCGKPIVGRCVSAMGHKFHPEHFVCAFCLTQLYNGIFQEQNGKTYCDSCFKKLFV
ncbi:leupaxin [Protobothrops mucrosquamatus]|uniref:leupaxin n=1 Tax=Protobothrops mucrosquamatus TaxID=103944 RepID=UPI000775DEC7|nr:leupaxin [Protobothrops mucrosquamatus]